MAQAVCGFVLVMLCADPVVATRPGRRPATQPVETPSEPAALKVLDKALERLDALASYRVQLHQVIAMLDYRFQAQGDLLWARGDRMRLAMTLTILNDRHKLLEVCDGKTLYRRLALLHGQEEILKTDVSAVRTELAKPGLPEPFSEAFMGSRLGLRGIAPLIRSLKSAFILRMADPKRRRAGKDADLTELTGRLRRDHLRALLGLRRGDPVRLDRVPSYVPVRCRILWHTKTGWPARVRLHGRDPKAYIELRLTRMQPDAEVPASAFAFEPAKDVQVPDQTSMLCAELRQRRAAASRPTKADPATAPSTQR